MPPEPDDLAPLPPQCAVIETRDDPDHPKAVEIAKLLATDPEVRFRVYGPRTAKDLEFLERFPKLRRLTVDDTYTTGFNGLRHVPNLVELSLPATSGKQPSLQPLLTLKNLEELFIENQSQDVAVAAELPRLRELILVEVKVPEQWELPCVQRLVIVQCALCSLPIVPELRDLRLRAMTLSDVSAVSTMSNLEVLGFGTVKGLNAFPSLKRLSNLHTLLIHETSGKEAILAACEAPALRAMAISSKALVPEDFMPLQRHKTLERIYVKLKTKRATAAVYKMLDGVEHIKYRSDIDPIPRR